MSSKTKIVVLHMKEVVYTAVFLALAIILLVVFLIMFGSGKNDSAKKTSISLNNLSETTAAMYPLMEPALDSIASQIYVNQTTEGLIYGEDDRYTSELLVSAINQALEQAKNETVSKE